jgi:cation diffusion facilitator family transporter
LISAITTLVAVRISARPADRSHQFGHGKFESLSALIEMLLLLITCAWVIYEAIQRLFFRPVEVNPSIWAFLIMGVSIVVDFSRSRALASAASKYNSQALEADALNYRNDMFSSLITIFGLLLVRLSQLVPSLHLLSHADSVAAMGLAVIILWVGSRMGGRALGGLLDRAPDISVEEIIKTVQSIPGVIDCHSVRVRASGPDIFIDAHVTMDHNMPLGEVHALMDKIEAAIQRVVPNADVDLHPEPDWKAQRRK